MKSLVVLTLLPIAASESCDAIEKVNGFIGTGGLGFGYGGVNPGAQFPTAPLRLGPDTTYTVGNIGYRHFSGYNYNDDQVRAFSHTHLVGAGMNGLGNFGVMPVRMGRDTESMEVAEWAQHDRHTWVWWSPMDKSTEVSTPGQYKVKLTGPDVDASLLATSTLSGVHQYVFAADEDEYRPGLVLDVCHSASVAAGIYNDFDCVNASVTYSQDLTSFSASVYVHRGIWMYLYGELDSSTGAAPTRISTCSNDDSDRRISCSDDVTDTHTSTSGMLFSRVLFPKVSATEASLLQVKVGLSFIDEDQAKLNYENSPAASASAKESLQPLVDNTQSAWCKAMGDLAVTGLAGDDDLEVLLHSANYRSLLTPAVYTEHGGLYRGLDKEVHNATADRLSLYGEASLSGKTMEYYSDFSFWDTFRSQHPWILLTDEPMAIGILRSISEMTQQQNGFPKWVLATVDTGSMVGLHGASAALEAGLSGFGNEFDLVGIQEMLVHQDTEAWPVHSRSDLDHYLSEGWVSNEVNDHSCSETLSYAYDDFVLAGLSKLVGDANNSESASARAKNYANVWSTKFEYMCPRNADGQMRCPQNPTGPDSWRHFTEGDTLHWSTFVMHDPLGLMGLYESPLDFQNHLQSFFDEHVKYHDKFGSSVPNPYFWMGNEVDSFAVWMFNNEGVDCSLAQYWSRELTHLHFSNTPHGVPGNEDYGAMASWLLFASLGVYPQAGTTNYYIGSPRVENAKLTLTHLDGSTSVLSISTENNSADNVYVEKLLVNGEEYVSPIIDRSVLAAKGGCALEFVMTSVPSSGLCPSSSTKVA